MQEEISKLEINYSIKEKELQRKFSEVQKKCDQILSDLNMEHTSKIAMLKEEVINEIEKLENEYKEKNEKTKLLNIDIDAGYAQAISRFKNINEFRDIVNITDELEKNKDNLNSEIKKKKAELRQLNEIEDLNNLGFYEKKYTFENSQMYKTELDRVRNEQKIKIKSNEILRNYHVYFGVANKSFIKKIKNQVGRLMLRNFNTESDLYISNVTYRNYERMENKIRKSHETINKFGEMFGMEILYEYLQLKIDELILNYEYKDKQEQERQEQRELLEQMREEEKAQREMERELAKAKREEERYERALEEAKKDLELAHDEEKRNLLAKIQLLERNLQEAQEKERAISQAQLTKAGHVYVISNIGSFGEDVYKIGMTRRLQPEDRVYELGNASVPFPFDIHAMIFSENAPELEKTLQKEFDHLRLNRVNTRKEFFKVSLDEIHEKAKQHKGDVYFTKLAEAKQYRESLALEKREIN